MAHILGSMSFTLKHTSHSLSISEIQEIQYSSTSENTENMCPIYCMPFTDNETICKLPCNHVFHYECLMKTFDNSNRNRCPYCREKACYLPLANGVKKIKPGIHCEDIQTQHILEKNHVKRCTSKIRRICKSNNFVDACCSSSNKRTSFYCKSRTFIW